MDIRDNRLRITKNFNKVEFQVLDNFETGALVIANFKQDRDQVIELRVEFLDNTYLEYTNSENKMDYIKNALSEQYAIEYNQNLNW